jgi:snRNA-activating protein complex subunit 3
MFADDAKASLAALDAALTSKAAVALLQRGEDLDWAEAVIPNPDVAIERAMLDAPVVRIGPEAMDADTPEAVEHRVRGLLPAPEDAEGKGRASKRKKIAATATATETETASAAIAATGDPLSTATAASLERAGALARAEAAAPLRCLRERDAVAAKGLASRKHRRRYKNADDVYAVAVDAVADAVAATPSTDGERSTETERSARTKSSGGVGGESEPVRRLVPGEDVLVSVGVHNPAKPAMVLEEFLCAGFDSLAKLKDRVTCAADKQAVEAGLPEIERRGFFFVEGVFHEDTRDGRAPAEEGEATDGTIEVEERDEPKRSGRPLDGNVPGTERVDVSASYATPIVEYYASLISRRGAGARLRLQAPGDRAFVAEAATAALESAAKDALEKGGSVSRARALADAAARSAAARARRRPPPCFEIGTSAETTTLNDLKIVRDKPYCMCHRGDCDHVVTFRQVRLAHPDDVLDASMYPLRTFAARRFRRKCSMCDVFEACVVTRGDKYAPCSPCFFCESCFECLHKDENGENAYAEYEKFVYHHE